MFSKNGLFKQTNCIANSKTFSVVCLLNSSEIGTKYIHTFYKVFYANKFKLMFSTFNNSFS